MLLKITRRATNFSQRYFKPLIFPSKWYSTTNTNKLSSATGIFTDSTLLTLPKWACDSAFPKWSCTENNDGSLSLYNNVTDKYVTIGSYCASYGCQGGCGCIDVDATIEKGVQFRYDEEGLRYPIVVKVIIKDSSM